MKPALSGISIFLCCLLFGSCANIVPPSGGPKDITPPKLRSSSPKDSLLNSRPDRIELAFNEYITLNEPTTQVQISPLIPIPLTVTSQLKKVIISIPDSLLQDETTYRITFGTAIRDLHEGNIYNSKGFTFSTGTYFDSLRLSGSVHDARTGLPDTAAFVLLYSAKDGDSAIVKHKPLYVTHVDAKGGFNLEGLPPRKFRIFALRDGNGNLTYDGGTEWVGFIDSVFKPGSSTLSNLDILTFPESKDDTLTAPTTRDSHGFLVRNAGTTKLAAPGSYKVLVDTNDIKHRSQDISKPISISFGRRLSAKLNKDKIFLSIDSQGTVIEQGIRIIQPDSSGLNYQIVTQWTENTVYTLRLQKGFAKDSNGNDLFPCRYTFRTKREEDYGKMHIHLPSTFYGPTHILQIANEKDTIYQQVVSDTLVNLNFLPPGVYTLRVIEDRNKNGRWDAGDLLEKRQPERVIPYNSTINMKAGWEQQVDFIEPRRKR